MKKLSIITLAAGALFTIASCQKKDNKVVTNVEPVEPTPVVDTSYIVSGLRNLTMSSLATNTLNVTVTRTSGAEKKVTLSVTGMPESSKVSIDGMSGYTSFSSAIKFITMFAKPAVYPISIMAKSETGEVKQYNINLTVEQISDEDCNNTLATSIPTRLTTYNEDDSTLYTQTYTFNNTSQSTLYLNNVLLDVDSTSGELFFSRTTTTTNSTVKMLFSCNDGTIQIPQQDILARGSIQGNTSRIYKVSGNGLVDLKSNIMSITYSSAYEVGGNVIVHKYVIKAPFSFN